MTAQRNLEFTRASWNLLVTPTPKLAIILRHEHRGASRTQVNRYFRLLVRGGFLVYVVGWLVSNNLNQPNNFTTQVADIVEIENCWAALAQMVEVSSPQRE